jgi:hypothetical protein
VTAISLPNSFAIGLSLRFEAMRISVVICTFNRASLLERTLGHMSVILAPENVDWELVVVNNNCTDNTDDVIAKFSDRLPIRRVIEEQQGLSNATPQSVGPKRTTSAGQLSLGMKTLLRPGYVTT